MPSMLNSMHDIVSWFVAVCCVVAIVHPRIPTGVLATLGLSSVFVGIVFSTDDAANQALALDIVVGGLLFVFAGLAWRMYASRGCVRMRRLADWSPPPINARRKAGRGRRA